MEMRTVALPRLIARRLIAPRAGHLWFQSSIRFRTVAEQTKTNLRSKSTATENQALITSKSIKTPCLLRSLSVSAPPMAWHHDLGNLPDTRLIFLSLPSIQVKAGGRCGIGFLPFLLFQTRPKRNGVRRVAQSSPPKPPCSCPPFSFESRSITKARQRCHATSHEPIPVN